jgi:hypothetical protein
MREICTSGSVRGEGGNILTYSAVLPHQRCEVRGKGFAATQALDLAEERQPARRMDVGKHSQDEPADSSEVARSFRDHVARCSDMMSPA